MKIDEVVAIDPTLLDNKECMNFIVRELYKVVDCDLKLYKDKITKYIKEKNTTEISVANGTSTNEAVVFNLLFN